jgi:hypothetical protein
MLDSCVVFWGFAETSDVSPPQFSPSTGPLGGDGCPQSSGGPPPAIVPSWAELFLRHHETWLHERHMIGTLWHERRHAARTKTQASAIGRQRRRRGRIFIYIYIYIYIVIYQQSCVYDSILPLLITFNYYYPWTEPGPGPGRSGAVRPRGRGAVRPMGRGPGPRGRPSERQGCRPSEGPGWPSAGGSSERAQHMGWGRTRARTRPMNNHKW